MYRSPVADRPRRVLWRALPLAFAAAACHDVTAPAGPSAASPPADAPAFAYTAVGASQYPTLFAGYNAASSPHFPTLRTQMSDYRIPWLAATARPAEYTWSAQHFDRIILDLDDPAIVTEYRSRNPSIEIYRYVVGWTVMLPGQGKVDDVSKSYYTHMQSWYRAHPEYRLEDAFLHDANKCPASTTATQACRVTFPFWNVQRWATNPADPGLRAYQKARLAEVASGITGVYLDEYGGSRNDVNWGGQAYLLQQQPLREFSSYAQYEDANAAQLAEWRTALAPKRVLLNTAEYIDPGDRRMAIAAGGAHNEFILNPFFGETEDRWNHLEALSAAGVPISVGPKRGMPAGYTAGSYASPDARKKMWNLASAYLVAPRQGEMYFNPIGDTWDAPFASNWLPAIEADLGKPTEDRQLYRSGTDGAGYAYRVWKRSYERAVVLVRPRIDWNAPVYGDQSAVVVPLPAGDQYRLLLADGSLGPLVTSVTLRQSEAAIVVKNSFLFPASPPPSSASTLFVLIDREGITDDWEPNYWNWSDVNDDIAAVGQRQELRWFAANEGRTIQLHSGWVSAEGWFALQAVPSSWAAAGPTTDGLRNYLRAGPGLGTPNAAGSAEALLGSVPEVTPLRATGLKQLVGRTVCALVFDNDIRMTSWTPLVANLTGTHHGIVAFVVNGVTAFGDPGDISRLPKLSVTVKDADAVCGGALALHTAAPKATGNSEPFDTTP